MADNFPEISSKLSNPTKKSLFERQREEAEAKKAREKAETAAVLEDFVKSFDDEGDAVKSDNFNRGGGRGHATGGAAPGLGKRHFTGTGLKSGPGSLGPSLNAPRSGPGSLGPPNTGYGKKRPYEDFKDPRRRDRDDRHGMFSYEDERERNSSTFRAEDEEDRKDSLEQAAKPTLHLSSLPPGTSPAVIKALFVPSPLVIENVRILPLQSSGTDRKSTSAIITLASETPATDIDTMVSHLQNRYLGFGFNLAISRHLSSTALSGATAISAPSSSLPFNARHASQSNYSHSRAPPPGQSQGRFAPPASYTSSTPYGSRSNAPASQVIVTPPNDLSQLKLIHKTLEALLTHGPEFEALLMSLPEIQRSEKWSWLFNARSPGGIYYRWRLWNTITTSSRRADRRNPTDVLFEGQSVWIPPEQNLKFEYTTELEEFVSDTDYDSSDEEDNDGGIARRYNDHTHTSGGPPPEGIPDGDGTGYLNPLAKTKLVHLLARLPRSNAKLRRGDVAQVTGFAIEHAGAGADEVAELVTANVATPMSTTNAGGNRSDEHEHDEDAEDNKSEDTSAASLVGLYVISDILSSSASAGVRHAWRYRALFETQLREQDVFARLGRFEKSLGWGKLKAEKWKRSIQAILSLWEGWCVFPQASHDAFVQAFLEPPLSEIEKAKAQAEEEENRKKEQDEQIAGQRSKSLGGAGANTNSSRWRSVEDKTTQPDVDMEDVNDKPTIAGGDVDGQPMDEDDEDENDNEDHDENLDGVPMLDSSDDDHDDDNNQTDGEHCGDRHDQRGPGPERTQQDTEGAKSLSSSSSKIILKSSAAQSSSSSSGLLNPRQRPRAVDMFADDESGGE